MFDDPNLVSAAGLVPVLALADSAGLASLAGEHLSVPGDKGANAGLKVASLVAGMVAGADSIDDMALLRHGGMGRVFARAYAPSTLGSFLRSFSFGHVRQLDAVASRFLTNLTAQAPQVTGDGTGGRVLVDVDDTIIEVHGHAKQGAGFGYSKVRGLNALLATATTAGTAPVVVAQRLRKGSCGSPRGAKRLVADALKTVSKLHGRTAGEAVAAGGLGVLRGAHGRCRAPRRGRCVGHRADGPQGQEGHRRHRRGRVDPDRVHRRHLRRGHAAPGCRGPRSPRCPSPRSPPRRPPSRCPAAWWCAASPT